MMSANLDYADVQGVVRYGYGGLADACFLLLRIKDRAAAQAWLRTAPVNNALESDPPPKTVLQIAFTRSGLEALRVPTEVIQQFSYEFFAGMVGEDSRSRRLGDIDANAPAKWYWGVGDNAPDLLLLLYAESGKLENWKGAIKGDNWNQAFTVLKTLQSEGLPRIEPFGFRDGISQPEIDWDEQKKLPADQLEYCNVTALGEFLLGYSNEYGKYSERPLLLIGEDASAGLLLAEEDPQFRDLGRNGSYLVLRQLEQDVEGFWRFINRKVPNPTDGVKLAEAMVGRRMSGEPLVASAAGDDLNQFTFDSDVDGVRCPFGAHIRRANPRNADYPYGTNTWWQKLLRLAGFHRTSFRDDLVSSTRFHRILRRGRPYGNLASPSQSAPAAGSNERGIYFIAINANISRQFEFVQNAWVMGTKFNGVNDESDPLVGNRQSLGGCPAGPFSIPQPEGITRRVEGLEHFITVRGGAYFFLPSIRALWYLATVGDRQK